MSIRSLFASLLSLGVAQTAVADMHMTSKCKQFSHPEFQIQVSSKGVPSGDIAWFLEGLEQRVEKGERFKSGETMQVGWMLTMLQERSGGTLQITEPDMKSVPVKFVDSVDNTLKQLRSQKDTAESFSPTIQLAFPSLQQSVVVHLNYKTTNRTLLSRTAPAGMDSGWWLSDLNDKNGNQDPKHFTKISLYQLAIDRPDLVKFFALSAGIQVVVDNNTIGVLKDGKEIPIVPGSFLSELNRVRR